MAGPIVPLHIDPPAGSELPTSSPAGQADWEMQLGLALRPGLAEATAASQGDSSAADPVALTALVLSGQPGAGPAGGPASATPSDVIAPTTTPGDLATATAAPQPADSNSAQLAAGREMAMVGTEPLTGRQAEPVGANAGFAALAVQDPAIGLLGRDAAAANPAGASLRPQTPSSAAATSPPVNVPSGENPAGLLPLADVPAAAAPITGIVAVAMQEGGTMLLARLADGPGQAVPPQTQFGLGAGLTLSLAGNPGEPPRAVQFDWHGDRLWPLMSGPLGQAAAGILSASASQAPIEAVSLAFGISMSRSDTLEPPSGMLRFADGQSVAFGAPASPSGPWWGEAASPAETRSVLRLAAGNREATDPGPHAVCESRTAVPIDLAPAPGVRAPDPPPRPLWRIDETRCFVVIGPQGAVAALAMAHALYRRLMSGDIGLAGLQPGEGLATWDGSPLWLRLAGIAKPPSLGVAFAESDPPRLEIWRESDGTWVVTRGSVSSRLPPDAAQDATLFHCALFGMPPDPPPDVSDRVTRYRGARAGMVWARQSNLTADEASRAEEAWAGVARHAAMTPGPCPALRAVLGADPADWQRLEGIGETVLARIANGQLESLGRDDGIALTMRLGRLPAPDLIRGRHAQRVPGGTCAAGQTLVSTDNCLRAVNPTRLHSSGNQDAARARRRSVVRWAPASPPNAPGG